MNIEPGTQLLHYRLIEKIGEGGMGVVWRASDTTLDRDVAIKILPADFAQDRARLARFEREAKLLASLSHPNIAVVHGLHEDRGVRFLAMELATGEDLSKRLARGPLPLDEALHLAAQIAEALEFAHESGVIHRDLKPANIHVDPDGSIKVLDFGLAKAFQGDPSSDAVSPTMSPTVTSTGTQAGTILGTAAYMSPEQAKGKVADKRADIWAFGCVLLETLTGRKVFKAESVAETLAQVLKEEPDWGGLPQDTPPRIRRLLRRCLVKDPRRRLRDIGDARIAIDEIRNCVVDEDSVPVAAAGAVRPSTSTWQRLLPWGLALLFAVALAVTWLGRPSTGTTSPGESAGVRLSVLLPEDKPAYLVNGDLEVMPSFAISRAGDSVVYTVRDTQQKLQLGGGRALQVRSLDDFDTESLRGTESAEGPFFSHDGRWIGFFDGSTLAKVPASGGARIDIVKNIGNGSGADWGADGTIVFAHSYVGPLWAVSDSGGEPRQLTTLGPAERSHRYPQLLPDGKSVLFTIKPSGILSFDDGHLAVADLESGEHRVLDERGSYARYVESGHLAYAREGALLAAPFDLENLRTTGGAVPVLEGLFTNPVNGTALFEIAEDGTLILMIGDYHSGPTSLFALDRSTGARERLAQGYYAVEPRLSPDGRRLLLHNSTANEQAAILDLERGTLVRVTDASTNWLLPIWEPSGDYITLTTDRSGQSEIVRMPADGGPVETLVEPSDRRVSATSWSPNGRYLASNLGVGASRDIWIYDAQTGQSSPFIETPYDEGGASFSPDGNWLAYESDESGRSEIYATAFPDARTKVQLSTGGGSYPRWRADGGELYYQSENELLAAPMIWGGRPRTGTPAKVVELLSLVPLGYDVTPDGRKFFIVEVDESHWSTDEIHVVLNWQSELRQLVAE